MPGVLADDPDDTFALDDATFIADGLDGASDLHNLPILINDVLYLNDPAARLLLESPGDAPLGGVVGGNLYADTVAGEDTDEVHPHLATDVSEDNVTVFKLHAEHRVWQSLNDDPLNLNCFFFCHIFLG